jgi:hypothetical protein
MQTNLSDMGRTMSPSLTAQTPGLDTTAPARRMAMRQVAWAQENPAVLLGVLGGLAAIAAGTWLILRARRPSRWSMWRDRGEDAVAWIRERLG